MNRELKSQMSKKSRVNEYNDYENQAVLNQIGTLFALSNILPYFAIALFYGMPQN